MKRLVCLAQGGTAVGTGVNGHPEFAPRTLALVSEYAGVEVRETSNHFQAQSTLDAVVEASGQLKTLAISMLKMANDIRLMGSGPRASLFEIELPSLQPGSSIMPGKVNPSMAENMNLVLFQVLGQCQALDYCVQAGQLELNVMMPSMAFSAQFSIQILTNTLHTFTDNCIAGITANEERCRVYAETSPSLATALNVYLGYAQVSEIVKESLKTGTPIPDVVRAKGLLDEETLSKALDPAGLTEPGIPGQ